MLFFVRRRSRKQRKLVYWFTKIAHRHKASSIQNHRNSKKASFACLQDLRLPFLSWKRIAAETNQLDYNQFDHNQLEYNQVQTLFNKLYTLS
jgi:hypothetical protein